MSPVEIPISLRAAVTGDLNFILNSWLLSYRNSDAVKAVPNGVYFDEAAGQKGVVLELVETAWTLVACDPGDEATIYGWACFDPDQALHFAFVKEPFRGMGVFRRLLDYIGIGTGPIVTTHYTRAIHRLKVHHGRDVIHNPFLLRRKAP